MSVTGRMNTIMIKPPVLNKYKMQVKNLTKLRSMNPDPFSS